MASFQVELGSQFQDFSSGEDEILKRAYTAGKPTARFQFRGTKYTCDFKRMVQINEESLKERRIRAPHTCESPSTSPSTPPLTPTLPSGPSMVVNVPIGSPGTVIQIPYPGQPGKFIDVNVPRTAKPGRAMLVPVPPINQAAGKEGS